MSFTADRQSRRSRRTCASCRERKARFQYRGGVRADRHHTLCFECFRSERERVRARRLDQQRELPLEASPLVPFDLSFVGGALTPPTLSERQVSHRRTMLANIERHRTAARRSAV